VGIDVGLGGVGRGSQLLEGARGRLDITFEDVRQDLPGEGKVQFAERADLTDKRRPPGGKSMIPLVVPDEP